MEVALISVLVYCIKLIAVFLDNAGVQYRRSGVPQAKSCIEKERETLSKVDLQPEPAPNPVPSVIGLQEN